MATFLVSSHWLLPLEPLKGLMYNRLQAGKSISWIRWEFVLFFSMLFFPGWFIKAVCSGTVWKNDYSQGQFKKLRSLLHHSTSSYKINPIQPGRPVHKAESNRTPGDFVICSKHLFIFCPVPDVLQIALFMLSLYQMSHYKHEQSVKPLPWINYYLL